VSPNIVNISIGMVEIGEGRKMAKNASKFVNAAIEIIQNYTADEIKCAHRIISELGQQDTERIYLKSVSTGLSTLGLMEDGKIRAGRGRLS